MSALLAFGLLFSRALESVRMHKNSGWGPQQVMSLSVDFEASLQAVRASSHVTLGRIFHYVR